MDILRAEKIAKIVASASKTVVQTAAGEMAIYDIENGSKGFALVITREFLHGQMCNSVSMRTGSFMGSMNCLVYTDLGSTFDDAAAKFIDMNVNI